VRGLIALRCRLACRLRPLSAFVCPPAFHGSIQSAEDSRSERRQLTASTHQGSNVETLDSSRRSSRCRFPDQSNDDAVGACGENSVGAWFILQGEDGRVCASMAPSAYTALRPGAERAIRRPAVQISHVSFKVGKHYAAQPRATVRSVRSGHRCAAAEREHNEQHETRLEGVEGPRGVHERCAAED